MSTDYSSPLTFLPIRNDLYTAQELMTGFDPGNFKSLLNIPDFQTYVYFVKNGRSLPQKPYAGMMEAIHDNSILQAMFHFINGLSKPTAAIMGGHGEERGSENYKCVVHLAKNLTEQGFLLASGGGPGAMEATHLGACFSERSVEDVDDALTLLSIQKTLPRSFTIVDKDGNVDLDELKRIHHWTKPAYELMLELSNPAPSLAIPTWLYGHEPLTPLATHVAKYFQNSIREDVLLSLATNGIVYAPGAAGTFQEVFQHAAMNYYRAPEDPFVPMVFYKRDFWCNEYPTEALLKAIFEKNDRGEEYRMKVRFLDQVEEIVEFLLSHKPSHNKTMQKLEGLSQTRKEGQVKYPFISG